MTITGTRRLSLVLTVLALATGLVACGDDDDPAVSAPETTEATGDGDFPVSIGDVTIEEAPERIVSLSPTATESLFAIGAGDQVVAVDDNSDYPEGVPSTELTAFEPNIEAIAEYEPDLVVTPSATEELVGGLRKLGIPVLVQLAAVEIDDIYGQIADLGKATGHTAEAAEVADDIRAEIDEVVADAGEDLEGLTYYYELDQTYYSVTSNSFFGKVIGLLGLENIADAAQEEANDYPQLSGEYIVEQDPDLIVLADTKCCQQSAATVAARAGWDTLQAVTKGGVVELDDAVASRWGPRVVELIRAVADAGRKVAAAA